MIIGSWDHVIIFNTKLDTYYLTHQVIFDTRDFKYLGQQILYIKYVGVFEFISELSSIIYLY
jgi:hypothetical protein